MALQNRECPQGYQMINGVCSEFGDVSSPCLAQCANMHPSQCGDGAFGGNCNCNCCNYVYTGPPPGSPGFTGYTADQYSCQCFGCWSAWQACVSSCQQSSWHGSHSGRRIGYRSPRQGGLQRQRKGGRIRRRR